MDEANPSYGDDPYTVQTGGCGEPGRWIHLTLGYLLHGQSGDGAAAFGPPGNVFLTHWARLRLVAVATLQREKIRSDWLVLVATLYSRGTH